MYSEKNIVALGLMIIILLMIVACAPAPASTPVPQIKPAPAFPPGSSHVDANTVAATKGTSAPKIGNLADDPIWAKAKATNVKLSDGANFKNGSTTATIKAAYVGDTLYALVQWEDPTQSYRRTPFVKQSDGTWKKLSDPDDKGGDNNKYYEDGLALIWNIGNSIKGFGDAGCFSICHVVGEPGKPFGNQYSATAGELGDIWQWKSVRTGPVSQMDNRFIDNTRYDKNTAPEAGRKNDAKTGGGYADINFKDGKPEFMNKDAKPANAGGTYWLPDADKVPFDDSKFKAGDEVASILVAPFIGERGEISAAAAWKDGKWTLALSRKLVTGVKTDVQFDKLDATYYFGIAAFDNAQVRHAFNTVPLELVFEK